MREIVGDFQAHGRRFAVVAARFNEVVTGKLVEGALACLRAHGIAEDDLVVAWVPGAFELPIVARRLAASGGFDAVICLGAVIRGETAHFEQATDRAGGKHGNKGWEAAMAAIETASVLDQLPKE
jgi:6,7-dimethyl-8-ribityllumazine synthase